MKRTVSAQDLRDAYRSVGAGIELAGKQKDAWEDAVLRDPGNLKNGLQKREEQAAKALKALEAHNFKWAQASLKKQLGTEALSLEEETILETGLKRTVSAKDLSHAYRSVGVATGGSTQRIAPERLAAYQNSGSYGSRDLGQPLTPDLPHEGMAGKRLRQHNTEDTEELALQTIKKARLSR